MGVGGVGGGVIEGDGGGIGVGGEGVGAGVRGGSMCAVPGVAISVFWTVTEQAVWTVVITVRPRRRRRRRRLQSDTRQVVAQTTAVAPQDRETVFSAGYTPVGVRFNGGRV